MKNMSKRPPFFLFVLSVLCAQLPAAGPVFGAEKISKSVPVTVSSEQEGGIIKIGEDVRVPAHKELTGGVIVIGGSADIEGKVEGDVAVIGGNLNLQNEVGGSVMILGRKAVLGPNASIGESFFSLGTEISRDPGAKVKGETVTFTRFGTGLLAYLLALGAGLLVLLKLISDLGWLLLAAVVALLFPQIAQTAQVLKERPVASFLIGLVTVPTAAFVIVAFVISIIGIPLVPLIVLFLGLAAIWGFVGTGYWIGEALAGLRAKEPPPAWVLCVLGVLLIKILSWMPVVRHLTWVIYTFGLGAALIFFYRWASSGISARYRGPG